MMCKARIKDSAIVKLNANLHNVRLDRISAFEATDNSVPEQAKYDQRKANNPDVWGNPEGQKHPTSSETQS